jgi:hypothetical protein
MPRCLLASGSALSVLTLLDLRFKLVAVTLPPGFSVLTFMGDAGSSGLQEMGINCQYNLGYRGAFRP